MSWMKYRDLVAHIERNGGKNVRTNGSHAIYRLPNGRTIPLVTNHMNAEASRNVFQAVKRALEEAGIPLETDMNKQKQLRRTLKTLKNQRDEARALVESSQASVEGILASKLAPVEEAKRAAEAAKKAAEVLMVAAAKNTERALMTTQQLRDENAALDERLRQMEQERDEEREKVLSAEHDRDTEYGKRMNEVSELEAKCKAFGSRIAELQLIVEDKKVVKLQKRLAHKAEELRLLTLEHDRLKGVVHRLQMEGRSIRSQLANVPAELHPLLRGHT